jgi:hypothetical protein
MVSSGCQVPLVLFDFLRSLVSDGLLDRHEVQNGREGKCQKKKVKPRKPQKQMITRRIVFFVSR